MTEVSSKPDLTSLLNEHSDFVDILKDCNVLDQDIIERLVLNRVFYQDTQDTLIEKFDSEQITAEQYFYQLMTLTQTSFKINLDILGKENFEKVFGEAGYHADQLTDLETFLKAYKDHE